MYSLKIAGAALNQTPLAWDENFAHILESIEIAKSKSVSLLCLPELCISGYGCEDAFHAAGTRKQSIEQLLKITEHTSDIAVAVGLPIFHELGLYNAACFIVNGEILGFSCKQFLANEGIHYEPRWFRPWPRGRVSEMEVAGQAYPIGDLCYELGNAIVGFEICEDAWVANRPGSRLSQSGVDIILNPSASHFAFGKYETRKRLVIEGSRAFSCAYLYANLLGNESGRAIYDGGTLIANSGRLIASGPRFSFKDVVITEAVVDLELGRLARARTAQASEESVLPEVALLKKRVEQWVPPLSVEPPKKDFKLADSWEWQGRIKEEEFTRAVSLGLFDYLRKSFSRGFVLSLSGGADSAAVASLVYFALRLAIKELGINGLITKLSYFLEEGSSAQVNEICSKLLTTVYLPSENSGEITKSAASKLAAEIACEHHEISVSSLISDYTQKIEVALGAKLTWEKDDIALQNIQARARGPLVWLFANIKNALLLATSNRSEVAVGYATMDGDTCGSISPIAGIDKAFIRKWLSWVETEGPDGIGPLVSLGAINKQEPTAELRPTVQTDEADLMPYEALEYIERAAIRDKKDPSEIITLLKAQFPQVERGERLRWVKLFFTLWSKSQWKRERYAPSFHLDDESLDPKTWCRFPILSGAYKKELSELS